MGKKGAPKTARGNQKIILQPTEAAKVMRVIFRSNACDRGDPSMWEYHPQILSKQTHREIIEETGDLEKQGPQKRPKRSTRTLSNELRLPRL